MYSEAKKRVKSEVERIPNFQDPCASSINQDRGKDIQG